VIQASTAANDDGNIEHLHRFAGIASGQWWRLLIAGAARVSPPGGGAAVKMAHSGRYGKFDHFQSEGPKLFNCGPGRALLGG
jgi:hypothetical protein